MPTARCLVGASATPGAPPAELTAAIDRDLGGMDAMKAAFEQAGDPLRLQLGDGDGGRRRQACATSIPNQDTPLIDAGRVLFGDGEWEHACHLSYQNRRGDYLKAWWSVLDCAQVSQRYAAARTRALAI